MGPADTAGPTGVKGTLSRRLGGNGLIGRVAGYVSHTPAPQTQQWNPAPPVCGAGAGVESGATPGLDSEPGSGISVGCTPYAVGNHTRVRPARGREMPRPSYARLARARATSRDQIAAGLLDELTDVPLEMMDAAHALLVPYDIEPNRHTG